MWDSISKQEPMMKVDVSPFSSLPHFPDIIHNSIKMVVSFEESFYENFNSDHTQESWNVSFTFEQGE